jgi:hypothetical protein
MYGGRRQAAAVAGALVLGACAEAPAEDAEAASASSQPSDGDLAEADAEVDAEQDPVAVWVDEATERIAAGDAEATTRFLHGSMHPSLRSEFRWCETAWFSVLDWSQPATLTVDAGPEAAAWTGEEGPLAGESFDDAQGLEVVIETEGEQATATVPFVLAGPQLHWLADCPPQPEPEPQPDPEPAPSPQAAEPETSTSGSSRGQEPAAPAPSAQGYHLTGTVTVFATLRSIEYADDNCRATGGYSDIGPGAQVRIEDGNGDLLALSRLGAPYEQPPTVGDGDYVTCHWDFGPVEVPRSDFYTVTVSHRGGPTMTYEELAADDWDAYLYFGS